jgi:hypothetical protein
MPRAPSRAAAAVLAALLLAACASAPASTEGGGGPADEAPSPDAPAAPVIVKAGWMDLKNQGRPGILTALTLVSASSKEGKLISSGRAQMQGGKVITDQYAARLVEAFERQGFWRFARKVGPMDGPQGALRVVWIDRGEGPESLFLFPGAL